MFHLSLTSYEVASIMENIRLLLSISILLLFTSRTASCFDHSVKPHCPPEEEICEFDWVIDYIETMIYYDENGAGNPIVVRNGSLFQRTGCDQYVPIDIQKDANKAIFADGSYKLIYGINGDHPGPSVVVYEGQQVVVNLKNNLLMEGITIHWHGMVQWHTPWMDGVGTVSHCPINPGETFQYRFLADPPGTHWYHSHLGTERTDGIAGALIVLPNPNNAERTRSDLPQMAGDFVMILADWKEDSSVETKSEGDWGLNRYSNGFNETECYQVTSDATGGPIGLFPFESALINGRGNHYLNKDNPEQPDIPELPLESFTVNRYGYYRFRVINVGMLYGFRVSVDKHDIQLISVDGNDVIMTSAESVIVFGGERADFIVLASEDINNYWIRTETLEASNSDGPMNPNTGLAILRYNGSRELDPRTERYRCRPQDPCRVINCPFGQYPDSYNIECVAASDLRSTAEQLRAHPVPIVTSPDEIQEIFLNFHFSSTAKIPFSTAVNGHVFVPPTSPPQIYPKQANTTASCDDLDCTDHCVCTYIVKLEKDKTVQMTLLNMDDASFGMPHPVHMHGHHFHVVKTGYPEYNTTSGQFVNKNRDILCNTKSCNDASWRNESWRFGNIPELNLEDPPQKDTIAVPRNGYVVLRLKADNPGFWFMHCHIEVHQIAGMAVLLQEGDISDMEPVPEGFPTCGSFKMTAEEFRQYQTPEGARKKKIQIHQQHSEVIYYEELDYHMDNVPSEIDLKAPPIDLKPPPTLSNEKEILKDPYTLSNEKAILKDPYTLSNEKADKFAGHFHPYHKHHRYHLVLIFLLAVSLLMNFVFITMCICRKCRRSSVPDKLALKKNMIAHALANQESLQPSESKQRLV